MKISSRRAGATLGALSLLITLPAFAKETAAQIAGRKAIAALYTKANQAHAKRDVKAMVSFLAPDFKYHRGNGQILNLPQYVAHQTQAYATGPAKSTLSSKIKQIQWRNADAIVYVEETIRYTQQGYPVEIRSTTRDYWSKFPKGWLIRQAAELQKRTFISGREVIVSAN